MKSRWSCELIIVAVLVIVGLSVWWFVSTKDTRQANVQYEQLIKFANRQAVEIAIIEQASKLANYKQQMTQNQQMQTIIPNPSMSLPTIADSKDVPLER